MTDTIDVVFGESEVLKGLKEEVELALNGADELSIIAWVILEELARLVELELAEPVLEQLDDDLPVEGLHLLLVLSVLIDFGYDTFLKVNEMLLHGDTLSDDVASHELLLASLGQVDLLLLLVDLHLPLEVVTSPLDGIHKLRLEEVIVVLQIEALMEKGDVDIIGQAHQTNGFVLYLGDKSLVVVLLVGNELG